MLKKAHVKSTCDNARELAIKDTLDEQASLLVGCNLASCLWICETVLRTNLGFTEQVHGLVVFTVDSSREGGCRKLPA